VKDGLNGCGTADVRCIRDQLVVRKRDGLPKGKEGGAYLVIRNPTNHQ